MNHLAGYLLAFCSIFALNVAAEDIVLPPPRIVMHIVSEQAGIDLTTAKIVFVTGMITQSSMNVAINELLETKSMPGDRLVMLSSGGGDVDAGERLLIELEGERAEGVRIVCVAMGAAHSMAFNIMSYCDVRLATAGTKMVAHKVEVGALPRNKRKTAKNLREMARWLEAIDKKYNRKNANMMGLDAKNYDMYADAENEWTVPQLLVIKYLNGVATIEK